MRPSFKWVPNNFVDRNYSASFLLDDNGTLFWNLVITRTANAVRAARGPGEVTRAHRDGWGEVRETHGGVVVVPRAKACVVENRKRTKRGIFCVLGKRFSICEIEKKKKHPTPPHVPKMPGTDNVQVVVRCRPLFGKELGEGRQTIVEMDVLSGSVSLKHPKGHDGEKKKFTFDKIFGETNTQRDVYDGAASEIVNASIEGYNGTIFCYGQTGTGKTHTMEGKDFPEEERGILPHAFHHVFASIEKVCCGRFTKLRRLFHASLTSTSH